jgi:GT2 family glycosyltransferase
VDEPVVPALSVVVTTHSRRDLLGDCLTSVRQATSRVAETVEVLVVDDGRQSAIDELIAEAFPEAALLTTAGNIGFAGAAMEGIRHTRGDWIALLNDDVTAEPDMFTSMLEAATLAPGVGSVAPQLRFADRPDTINSAGIEIDALLTPWDRLVGATVAASEAEPVEVFGASAGAALYRRAMLDEIGGFDVSFFAYLEDVDLAWRARMHGWRCIYAPQAVVYHWHSATFGHHSPLKHFLTGRNRIRLIAKNADTDHLRRYAPAIALYDLAYVVFVGIRERTFGPARGRLQGLREWRAYRLAGSTQRRWVPLARRRTLRSALARDGTWPGRTAP